MAVYRDTATHDLLDDDEMHGRFDNDMLGVPSGTVNGHGPSVHVVSDT